MLNAKLISVTCCAGILAIGLAVIITMFMIIPTLQNTCRVFDRRCRTLTYQALPNGQILVRDPVTSFTHWYDGKFIRTYGPVLPGMCPSTVTLAATGATAVIGDDRILCERFDANGTCVSQNKSATPPTAQDGMPVATSAGRPILEPAFVMNASTLQASEEQILCSRARHLVEASFADAPIKTEKIRVPTNQSWVDTTQIFTILRNRVYTPPAMNPEPPVCNGHGFVNPLTATCVCDPGYAGTRCATRLCEDDSACVHGTCNGGRCECESGWVGDSCELRACGRVCVRGQCDGQTGVCVCDPGFTGVACDQYVCTPSCVHGVCDTTNGVCRCDAGWTGTTCENIACPNDCSGHGFCTAPDGVCQCVEGWIGVDCATVACVNNCSMHGECNLSSLTCDCDPGWTGVDCSVPVCLNGCCAHGSCEDSVCRCSAGWGGADCSEPDDPLTTAARCPTLSRCSPFGGAEYDLMYVGNTRRVTFQRRDTTPDAEGYTWYMSSEQINGVPVIEIGVKTITAAGFTLLQGKVRGVTEAKETWWSKGVVDASYENPAPMALQFHVYGTGDLNGCYTMNSVGVDTHVGPILVLRRGDIS